MLFALLTYPLLILQWVGRRAVHFGARVWYWLRAAAGFEPGIEIDANSSLFRETVTLFGVLLSAGGGLIVGQIDSARPIWQLVILFGLVAFATISGMVVILMAKKDRKHLYDWPTIRFTQFTLTTSLLIVISFGVMAATGRFPFSGFSIAKDARIGVPQPTAKERYNLPIALTPDTFAGKALPEKLFLELSMTEEFARQWKIANLTGFSGIASERQPMRYPPQPYEDADPQDANKSYWFIDHLDPRGAYMLYVTVGPTGEPRQLSPEAAEKGLKAKFYSREK